MEFTIQDGKKLINFARNNIRNYLKNQERLQIPQYLKEKYSDKLGSFVTLKKIHKIERRLRGCIGITLPVYPLIETVSHVSLSAAFEDPRFPQVSLHELNEIIIEISILTVPELIKVKNPEEDYFNEIKIGRDGLLIEKGIRRGLLLPQVPVDNDRNWDTKTFLIHLCMKASLSQDAWKNKETRISKFQALIFEEEEPGGNVHRK
ncbi:MAG: TIGR00296 family protein [Promethearchaeota archaeon]